MFWALERRTMDLKQIRMSFDSMDAFGPGKRKDRQEANRERRHFHVRDLGVN